MKILQLCCFTNLWPDNCDVESHDIINGNDVMLLPDDYGKNFDLVAASPPCVEFTRANTFNWNLDPRKESIDLVKKCLKICKSTGKYWFLENPPGRIEKYIDGLKKYRILTWRGNKANKEYVVYGNFIILHVKGRRSNEKEYLPRNQIERNKWKKDFINDIYKSLNYGNCNTGMFSNCRCI